MAVTVVFETHSLSTDNDRGAASGWHHSKLSERGRALARALGDRRRDDGLAAVLCSDLRRARETAELALGDAGVPILFDWRLRECDYGELNGGPADTHVQSRAEYLDRPYPGGESWREAVGRVNGCLDDIAERWDGRRVLVIGHVATRWALDHAVHGTPLEQLVAQDFAWREGWEYYVVRGSGPRMPFENAQHED